MKLFEIDLKCGQARLNINQRPIVRAAGSRTLPEGRGWESSLEGNNMRSTFLTTAFLVAGMTSLSASGEINVYRDFATWSAAAGDVRTIDFEAFPDGSPVVGSGRVEILDETVNYTDQGVTFGYPFPSFALVKVEERGSGLPEASGVLYVDGGTGTCVVPPWLDMLFDGPVRALGAFSYAGGFENLYLQISPFDFEIANGAFAGIVSDEPLTQATIDTVGIGPFSTACTLTLESFVYTPAGDGPLCEIAMSASDYWLGDQVTVDSVRFANPGPADVSVEARIWFDGPKTMPDPIIRGVPGVLAPGHDQVFGPFTLFGVESGTACGPHEIGCRLVDPTTGKIVAEGATRFDVRATPPGTACPIY